MTCGSGALVNVVGDGRVLTSWYQFVVHAFVAKDIAESCFLADIALARTVEMNHLLAASLFPKDGRWVFNSRSIAFLAFVDECQVTYFKQDMVEKYVLMQFRQRGVQRSRVIRNIRN